jgi:hypothetical protein
MIDPANSKGAEKEPALPAAFHAALAIFMLFGTNAASESRA